MGVATLPFGMITVNVSTLSNPKMNQTVGKLTHNDHVRHLKGAFWVQMRHSRGEMDEMEFWSMRGTWRGS